jgi:hypothetical protein
MPMIRPIRFSALKAFNPLHQEVKEPENENRQADIGEVEHEALQTSISYDAQYNPP